MHTPSSSAAHPTLRARRPSPPPTDADTYGARLREAARFAARELASVLATVALLLPTALIFGHGEVRGVGLAYAFVYVLALSGATAAYLALLLDAALLMAGKYPLFLQDVIEQTVLDEDGNPRPDHQTHTQASHRRAATVVERFIRVTSFVHPLSALTGTLLVAAIRLRPELFRYIVLRAQASKRRRPVVRDDGVHPTTVAAERFVDTAFREERIAAGV